ncbi:ATP-binding cassette domain-containing protein, partial [Pluralibacter gergoviae]
MLQIENLTLSLKGAPLVSNLSLSVAPGEIVTLTGASGSGKSTLFSWIVGALPPAFRAEGRLWLDGRRCDTLPVEARRIGILFQDALLFDHFSVGQNLLVALPAGGTRGERRA